MKRRAFWALVTVRMTAVSTGVVNAQSTQSTVSSVGMLGEFAKKSIVGSWLETVTLTPRTFPPLHRRSQKRLALRQLGEKFEVAGFYYDRDFRAEGLRVLSPKLRLRRHPLSIRRWRRSRCARSWQRKTGNAKRKDRTLLFGRHEESAPEFWGVTFYAGAKREAPAQAELRPTCSGVPRRLACDVTPLRPSFSACLARWCLLDPGSGGASPYQDCKT
jgi:hypothetical protein